MATNLMKARYPQDTLVYIGRRTFRHKSEKNWKTDEERAKEAPEQFPHTFVDFSNVPHKDVLEQAGGKQGCVVDTQKIVREKSTLAEVNAYRDAFKDVDAAKELLEKAINLNVEDKAAILAPMPVKDDEGNVIKDDEGEVVTSLGIKEPYVVIDFATAGTKLDVPQQPIDLLNKIKELVPEVYETMLAPLDEEEQLEKAPGLYAQLKALIEKA